MQSTIYFCLAIITIAIVNAGFLHGYHHHFPPGANVISSRTIFGSSIDGRQSSGAFSSARYSQTVSAPAHVQSVISTHHPISNGYSNHRGQDSEGNYVNHGDQENQFAHSHRQGSHTSQSSRTSPNMPHGSYSHNYQVPHQIQSYGEHNQGIGGQIEQGQGSHNHGSQEGHGGSGQSGYSTNSGSQRSGYPYSSHSNNYRY